MALSEKEKRILKEKYKESRRESWGILTRKRKDTKNDPSLLLPSHENSSAPRVVSSTLHQSSQPSENTANSAAGPSSQRAEDVGTSIPASASESRSSHTVYPGQNRALQHQESPNLDRETTERAEPEITDPQIRQQLQEKIQEERRATWAGGRNAPGLGTPPRRRTEKAEREFWDDSPNEEKKKGLSLGIALLVVVGCIGVVVIGVLLGYLLTTF